MKTNICLKALGEPFQDAIHINTVGVSPSVLEIFFQSLSQWVRDLMETNEFTDTQHLRVISCSSAVQSLDYCWYVSENTRVHKGCKKIFDIDNLIGLKVGLIWKKKKKNNRDEFFFKMGKKIDDFTIYNFRIMFFEKLIMKMKNWKNALVENFKNYRCDFFKYFFD